MTDQYVAACRRARKHARKQMEKGVQPGVLADALMTQAIAIFEAETGRSLDAVTLLSAWHQITGDARGS